MKRGPSDGEIPRWRGRVRVLSLRENRLLKKAVIPPERNCAGAPSCIPSSSSRPSLPRSRVRLAGWTRPRPRRRLRREEVAGGAGVGVTVAEIGRDGGMRPERKLERIVSFRKGGGGGVDDEEGGGGRDGL